MSHDTSPRSISLEPTARPSRTALLAAARRAQRLCLLPVVAGALLLAAPAMADRPQGWEPAEEVSFMDLHMLIVVWPLVLFAIITLLFYVPVLIRGGKFTSQASAAVEDQWLGGPRTERGELAEPSPETKQTGGASGSW